MTWLITGLALFMLAHLALRFSPSGADDFRERRGDQALKGLVALPALAGMVLIVLGWRSIDTMHWIYAPNPALRLPAMLLIGVGIYLFTVSNRPSVIKRRLRHPQLTGLLLWSGGHLLANGELRSLVLFGSLGAWSGLEILLINKRQGAWEKPEAPALATDLTTLVLAAVVIAGLVWAHPWLAGVALI